MVFCGIKNQKLLFKVCSFLNFRMWFKYGLKQHALKGQKLLAQGVWGQNLGKFSLLLGVGD